ncbi:type II toxin-antitoxin system Phd/YefM family antitoxin [Chlorobium limicola]|uniref:Prevent-host-death protein n=1 Tax=Chlorobium limicola TaxID=1092 RepID=A0A124G6R1_CHLLI|nr:type II toxin-antitoxin system prevent-host-death family antitoxin [Chlorobium limicola]KUL20467.1 prevent-host-death protein [Chlorobium limicola]
MQTVTLDDAQKKLVTLVEQASLGDAFIITRSGNPLVKVIPVGPVPESGIKRLGFMADEIHVPDDFDQMNNTEIEKLFADG